MTNATGRVDEVTHDATRAATFEAHRPALLRLAYRMKGAYAEAEDIVQDAWLRWSHHAPAIDEPLAWPRRTVTRPAIDHMRSARVRRERYVGPWLPEPLPATVPLASDGLAADPNADPHAALERADEVTVALLLALERLDPVERAAFLLHDVFDVPFGEIASVVDRSPVAARKIASRARAKVRDARPRAAPAPERQRFAAAFRSVLASGDVAGFTAMLADDVALHVDADGTKRSALRVLRGADEVMGFLLHVLRAAYEREGRPPRERPGDLFAPVQLAGEEGYAVREPGGSVQVWTFDWHADGAIAAIHIQRNEAKLRGLDRAKGTDRVGHGTER